MKARGVKVIQALFAPKLRYQTAPVTDVFRRNTDEAFDIILGGAKPLFAGDPSSGAPIS